MINLIPTDSHNELCLGSGQPTMPGQLFTLHNSLYYIIIITLLYISSIIIIFGTCTVYTQKYTNEL